MNDNKNINETLKKIWDGLTDDQRARAKECKNMDELTELAAKFGVELPDEMLETVAGGRPKREYYSAWDKDPSLSKGIRDC